MMRTDRFNPFPGLRRFEPDEDHLFFGREQQIEELLQTAATHAFPARSSARPAAASRRSCAPD